MNQRGLILRLSMVAALAGAIGWVAIRRGFVQAEILERELAYFGRWAPGALADTYLGYAGREAVSGHAGAIHKALIALALLAAVAFPLRLVGRLKGQRFTNALTLKHWLENGRTVALIDVRSAEEFAGPLGHIAGAVNIPLAQLLARASAPAAFGGQPIITI